jgi:MFS family permease
MLLPSLGTSIANVALPTLAQSFAASFQTVQWIVLAYLLAITTSIVGAGRLGDLLGRRRLLLAGIGLFTVASIVCGVAPVLWMLIAARAAQGLGAALMMALTIALVSEVVPRERTGRAMGLLGTMSAIGTALGPSLGGTLISVLGWRAIFLVQVSLGVATLLLARRWLPADRRQARPLRGELDAPGTLLLALTLGAYALAMTLGRGRPGVLNVALLVAAAVGARLLVRAEARSSSPSIRWGMLREPALGSSLAMSAIVSTVLMATLVVGPFYLSRGLGLGAALVGLVMSAGPLVAALAGVPAGRLVDALGAPRVTVAGLAGVAAGSSLLSALPARLGVAGYVIPIAIVTAGYALFQAANTTAIMTDVGRDERGIRSGMLNLSRNLGLVTGASVMGAVFSQAAGSRDVMLAAPAAIGTGLRTTFAVATVLAAVALTLASRSGATRRPSAVDHPLRSLRVARPLDVDGAGRVGDLALVGGREHDGGGAEVLLEPVQLRRPWDGDDPRLAGEQPGERDLRRRDPLPRRDRAQQVHQRPVRLPVLGCEAGDGVAEVAAVEGRRLVDLAGQEAPAERAEGDEADAELLERRQDLLLRLPPEQRVLALQGGDALHRVGATDGLHARLGEAEVPDLPLLDELLDGPRDLLDRHVGIHAMLVVEVDRVDA